MQQHNSATPRQHSRHPPGQTTEQRIATRLEDIRRAFGTIGFTLHNVGGGHLAITNDFGRRMGAEIIRARAALTLRGTLYHDSLCHIGATVCFDLLECAIEVFDSPRLVSIVSHGVHITFMPEEQP